jgi:hypothetical protein
MPKNKTIREKIEETIRDYFKGKKSGLEPLIDNLEALFKKEVGLVCGLILKKKKVKSELKNL